MSVCTGRPVSIPTTYPPTHPQPGAGTPRLAHVVEPRLQERAASGARAIGEEIGPVSSHPSSTSLALRFQF